jgi:hypothetical protein
MVNINSVYLSPMDGLSCDIACVVTKVLWVCVDKITCFKKGNHCLLIPKQRIVPRFSLKSYHSREHNYEFDWLLKSAEIGCGLGQKLI